MAQPFCVSLKFTAGVATAVAIAQNPAAAGPFTINGTLAAGGVATFDAPRRVAWSSTGNEGATIFTTTGTDRYGNVITESLTIPNATIALTQQDFATVTAASTNAATVGNVSIGTSNATTVGSSPWIPFNTYVTPGQAEFWLTVASANPSTCTLEYTPDDANLMAPPGGTAQVTGSGQPGTVPQPGSGATGRPSFTPPQAWADTTIFNVAANTNTVKNGVPNAWRLTINSGTTAATLQGIQAGVTQ